MAQLAKKQVKALGVSPARELSEGDVLQKYRVSEISADETTDGTEDVIIIDASGGAITVTLKTPIVAGQEIVLKKGDASANAVTIATEGSEVIDGSATQSLAGQYDKIRLVSKDDDDWAILNT